MRKIKSVEVLVSGPEGGVNNYYIGKSLNGLTIAEIRDASLEYEDSRHGIFDCRDADGKLVATIDNCPVVVEYMEVQKNK